MQQQMDQAQAQLDQLKSKLEKAGITDGSGGDLAIPDFTPNRQRTKSFLQRMEYGLNIQSQQSGRFIPATSDIALTVGYKINDRSVAGFGASYRVGWGNGLDHLRLTNEGIGLIFTKVLDTLKLGLVDEDEPLSEIATRANWESQKATPETVKLADMILDISKTISSALGNR